MAIIFPNTNINAHGNTINVKGSIIQFVDNTTTVNTTAGSATWVQVLSTSITTSKAGNRILVEYLCNHRLDFTIGDWSLVYHQIQCNGVQCMYSGHMGAAAQHIGYYERTFVYDGTANMPAQTYTFVAYCLAYQGTASLGTNNSGSTQHYLRLYEIGT